MRRDGTDRQILTPDTKGSDTHPAACGRDLVVFRSARDGQFDLYVMRSDGSDVRRLTNDPGNEMFPVCSPDGGRIAFISDRDKPGSRLHEVYFANLAQGLTNLTRVTNNNVQEGHPGFSPDGAWLVFTSEAVESMMRSRSCSRWYSELNPTGRCMPITSRNVARSG